MQSSEIEELVNELETRVDRLRALYEQYFMGIEKMEPHVPKKDVDRRIQVLRREQIRNTALRFRFQMIIQRYNTYQTYWIRICRQIEEGTYKRHVMQARAKLGDGELLPNRKRWKKDAAEDAAAGAPSEQELGDADFEFEEEAPTAAMPSKAPAPPPLRAPGRPPPVPGARASIPDAGEVAAAKVPTPAPPAPAAAAAAKDATKEDRMRELARRLSASKGAPGAAPNAPAAAPNAPAAPAAAPASAPKPVVRPAPAAPVAAAAAPASSPKPAAAPAAAKPAAAAAAPAAAPAKRDLSEERMRQLYSELVETKRKQKESTASVTYEGMVKTLRESSAKLKEKHGGRSVDFEVTVKDGKTILRPVVR